MLSRLVSMITSSDLFAQCVVAKYVPDLGRMEAHNIGVFIWTPGELVSKFLPADQAAAFVDDLDTYNRWVQFWTDKTTGEELTHKTRSTPKDSPQYLDALLATQKGNYRLTLAAETLTIRPGTLNEVVEDFFNRLVKPQPHSRVKFSEPPSDRFVLN